MAPEEGRVKKQTSTNNNTTENVVKTIILVVTWISLGLYSEITGPTLQDLIIKTNSDYELVSRAISGRGIGFFIGAVIGGPLIDKLGSYNDLLIAVCLAGAAITTERVPYSSDVTLLWFLFNIGGIFEVIINIAGNKILLNLWKERAIGPLHLLHFGYGAGSFIVPLIVSPFLAVVKPLTENKTFINTQNASQTFESAVNQYSAREKILYNSSVDFPYNTSTFVPFRTYTVTPYNVSKVVYLKESRIEYAYLIVAIIVGSLSLPFFVYQFFFREVSYANLKLDESKKQSKIRKTIEVADPATCANGDRIFGIQMFSLLFLFFYNVTGGERLYGKFIRSYALNKHYLSEEKATLINTTFWISFATSRFAGMFTGKLIPIRILLLLQVLGAFATSVMLEIFARESGMALWILTVAMGIFMGPLFPIGIAWGDFHVELTGFAITFVLIGSAFGDASYLWVIGSLYENHGCDMFLHQNLFCGGILFIITILLTILGKRHSGRFENKSVDIDIKNEDGGTNYNTEYIEVKTKESEGSDNSLLNSKHVVSKEK